MPFRHVEDSFEEETEVLLVERNAAPFCRGALIVFRIPKSISEKGWR